MPPAPHPPVVQEDDQDIQEEGLDSLTEDELRQACRWGRWWGGSWPAQAEPGQLASAVGWKRKGCLLEAHPLLHSPLGTYAEPPRPLDPPSLQGARHAGAIRRGLL